MAQVVFGAGTSHSPHVNTPSSMWGERAQQDFTNPLLFDRDGVLRSWEDVRAGVGDQYKDRCNQEKWDEDEKKAQAALDKIKEALAAAKPDVVIIVGDDQAEMFSPSNQPAIAIGGAADMNTGVDEMVGSFNTSEFGKTAAIGYWKDKPHPFKGSPELATDLARRLNDQGVDIGWLGGSDGYGHAFGFIMSRLMAPDLVPVIPIAVNCFWAPNQPTPKRCFEIGRALRTALDESPIDARVAIIASGGVSHFVVDEALDIKLLDGLKNQDWDTLTSIPPELLQGGTSEGRNWILVGAAMGDAKLDWYEYVDVIRTDAGTGCGLAFGIFS
ncbi:MAG: hypothetical protein FWF36_09715 [Propionibacteriaceae bacterium]|nr:hypothetical protein [Propionibacteriaceae bacterium]